jgi:hypothetical protein
MTLKTPSICLLDLGARVMAIFGCRKADSDRMELRRSIMRFAGHE